MVQSESGVPLPRSTGPLRRGDVWALPLSDGTFAAAVVLATTAEDPHPDSGNGSRIFEAGLLDWHGLAQPDVKDLDKVQILEWGSVHIRAIQSAGGGIFGRLANVDRLNKIFLKQPRDGQWAAKANGLPDPTISPSDAARLPEIPTYGFGYLTARAEHLLVQRSSPEPS